MWVNKNSSDAVAWLQIHPMLMNVFVTLIKVAGLTSELPDTTLTLLDSCTWLGDTGYQANYIVSV